MHFIVISAVLLTMCTVSTVSDEKCGIPDTAASVKIGKNTPKGKMLFTTTFNDTSLSSSNDLLCYLEVVGQEIRLARQFDGLNLISCADNSATTLSHHVQTVAFVLSNCNSDSKNLFVQFHIYNTQPPKIVQESNIFTVNVSEDAVIGSEVFTFAKKVIDPEGSVIHYQMNYNSQPSNGIAFKFKGQSNSIVELERKLDFETESMYNLSVTFKDSLEGDEYGPSLSTNATLIIYVQDADDQNPVFSEKFYRVSLLEEDSSKTEYDSSPVVFAYDADANIGAKIEYSIESGHMLDNQLTFGINNITGKIFTYRPVDREVLRTNLFNLIIKAAQVDNPILRTAEAFLIVSIEDLNDNSPVITSGLNVDVNLVENPSTGDFITAISATDADQGNFSVIEYELQEGQELATIDESSGVVRVTNPSYFDYENVSHVIIKAFAREPVTLGNRSSNIVTINVTLIDANDNDPRCDRDQYQWSLAQNASVGDVVGKVTGSDSDSGINSQISFTLFSNEFFSISATGEVQLIQNTSQMSQNTYNIIIIVKDSGLPKRRQSFCTAIINANATKPVAEIIPPVFEQTVYNLSLSEASAAPMTILFFIIDNSLASGKEFNFTITSGDNQGQFEISHRNQLVLAKSLDRENIGSYTLQITAYDKKQSNISAIVNIIVLDHNDNYPQFVNSSFVFRVREHATAPLSLGFILATDEDLSPNNDILYTLPTPSNIFSINSTSGELVLISSSLDFESLGSSATISLTVEAEDQGAPLKLKSRVPVMVQVEDINDNAPLLSSGSPTQIEIVENSSGNITLFKCEDKDTDINSVCSYSLNNDLNGSLLLDNSTGLLSSVQPITSSLFGDQSRYTVSLVLSNIVSYSDASITDTEVNITLTIKDVNDHGPKFTNSMFPAQIQENFTVGDSILKVTSTDSDITDLNRQTRYLIHPNSTNVNYFQLNAQSGELSLRKTIDRDAPNNQMDFLLTIIAYNVEPYWTSSIENDTSTIQLNISDVNDNSPQFTQALYLVVTNESIPVNSTISSDIQASDIDSGVNSQLTYKLLTNTTLFSIDSETGHLKVINSLAFDGNKAQIHYLDVEVTDSGLPPRSGRSKISVQIDGVNNNQPTCLQSNFPFIVAENSIIDSLIGAVTAADVDQDVLHFNISSNEVLSIDSKSGLLKLIADLNLQSQSNFNFTVFVSDGVFVTECPVYLNVRNTYNHAPQCNQTLFTFNFTENDQSFSANVSSILIGQINGYDPDTKDQLEFTLANYPGNSNPNISLNKNGSIYAIGIIDREAISEIRLTVELRDNGRPSLQTVCSAVFSIEDINDNAPILNSNLYTANVPENSQNPSIIKLSPSLSASDRDIGDNARLVFRFISLPNDSFPFEINNTSGVITQNLPLNREINANYTFKIEVCDSPELGDPLCSQADISLSISDINDNYPIFEQTTKIEMNQYRIEPISVQEGNKVPLVVTRLVAKDLDGGTASLIYKLLDSGADSSKFLVDSISGDLIALIQFDREIQSLYQLNISVSDNDPNPHSLLSYVQVNISIEDVNDNTPIFSQNSFTFTIEESASTISSLKFNIQANDSDLGNNSRIDFRIKSSVSDLPFSLETSANPDIAVLGTTRALDRETQPEYSFIVEAIDNGSPQRTSTASVTVSVGDINDNAPIFSNKPYEFMVVESSNKDATLGVITASDSDIGSNGELFYSLGDEQHPFAPYIRIDPAKGIIFLNQTLDMNTLIRDGVVKSINGTSYSPIFMTVTVRDNGLPSLSDSTNLTLTIVTEAGDAGSLLGFNSTNNQEIVTVREDISNGSYIATLHASVPAKPFEVVTYTLETANVPFRVEPSTGIVYTTNMLDRESTAAHILFIKATTQSQKVAYALLEVRLDDVNDNAPTFSQSVFEFTLSESQSTRHTIVNFKVSDQDVEVKNRESSFSIISGDVQNTFSMSGSAGELVLSKPLDFESLQIYDLVVEVTNTASPNLKSTCQVKIKVTDSNDNSPVIYLPQNSFNVSEKIPINSEIVKFRANDSDSGINSFIAFTLKQLPTGVNDFYLKYQGTGEASIHTQTNLNYSQISSYTLSIEAMDQGNPPLKTTENITIDLQLARIFTQSEFRIAIVDDTSAGTEVRGLVNDGVTGVTFSITSGNDNDKFDIQSNGKLVLKNRVTASVQSTYTLQIQAENQNTNIKDFTTVIVTVTESSSDVTFPGNNINISLTESADIGYVLIDLNTTDETNGRLVEYTIISGNEGGFFKVELSTGVVSLVKKIDRESGHIQFSLVIEAQRKRVKRETNPNPNRVTLVIPVTDVNDNAPTFSDSSPHKFSVSDSVEPNRIIYTAQATDSDAPPDNIIRYDISNSADKSKFNIDPNSGELTVLFKMADTSQSFFILEITATDKSGSGQSTALSLNISRLGINYQVVLVAPITPAEFSARQGAILANLSDILDLDVRLSTLGTHVTSTNIDPFSSDALLYAYRPNSAELVPGDELLSLMKTNSERIAAIFAPRPVSFAPASSLLLRDPVTTVMTSSTTPAGGATQDSNSSVTKLPGDSTSSVTTLTNNTSPSSTNSPGGTVSKRFTDLEIGLIVLASVLFLILLLTIILCLCCKKCRSNESGANTPLWHSKTPDINGTHPYHQENIGTSNPTFPSDGILREAHFKDGCVNESDTDHDTLGRNKYVVDDQLQVISFGMNFNEEEEPAKKISSASNSSQPNGGIIAIPPPRTPRLYDKKDPTKRHSSSKIPNGSSTSPQRFDSLPNLSTPRQRDNLLPRSSSPSISSFDKNSMLDQVIQEYDATRTPDQLSTVGDNFISDASTNF